MRTKRAQNAANGGLDSQKLVWRLGSARTHWGSLQHSPDPLAGFRGEGWDGREGGAGSEGRGEMEKGGREGRDRPAHFLVASATHAHRATLC